MIKTRDLLIFVAILFFLLVGITLTWMRDTGYFSVHLPENIPEVAETTGTYTAEAESRTLDRSSIVDRLRQALASMTPEVEPSPSVEESEESTSEEDMEVIEATEVTYCSTSDDTAAAMRSWPASGLSIVVEGNTRSVVHTDPVSAASAATSTASGTVAMPASARTLISFPAYPVVTGESCVGGEIVGVTTTGSLMYNSEVAFYRGYGAEYLIGYARDGFPIYGYYAGEVDACGGYMHPSGYRYSITPDRDYLIGCFQGDPSAFVGL